MQEKTSETMKKFLEKYEILKKEKETLEEKTNK